MATIHCESPVAAGRTAAWFNLYGANADSDGCEVTYDSSVTVPQRAYNCIYYWVARHVLDYYGIRDHTGARMLWVSRDDLPGVPWATRDKQEAVQVCNFLNAHRIAEHKKWLSENCLSAEELAAEHGGSPSYYQIPDPPLPTA